GVTLLGGTAAIGTAVETQLKGTASSAPGNPKLVVSRIAGINRFDTARKLAEQVGGGNVGSQLGKLTAIVTRGDNFPDALAGGPHGGTDKAPILLTTGLTGIPTKVVWWLEDHHATLANGDIFGGTAAVTTDQQGQATAAAQAGIVVLDNLTA